MYEIKQNGVRISLEDKARYVRMQSNGTYCLCGEIDAHGVVVNNDYICPLVGRSEILGDAVAIEEINGAALLADAEAALADLGIEPEEVPDEEL